MSTANSEKFNPEAERQASQVAIVILETMLAGDGGVSKDQGEARETRASPFGEGAPICF